MTLQGKVAIVTGGNTGIGKAVVLGLAAEGASIVIDYVSDPDAAEALEQQVRALGDQVVAVNADVSKIAELEKLIGAAVSNFGRLDIMVNNAGIETRTSVLDTTEDQYERVLAINFEERVLRHPARRQADDRPGRRGTDHQHDVGPRGLADARQHPVLPLEGGMRMLTRTAGVELAPHNVLVVGVGPGAVETPINAATINDPAALKKLDDAIPIGRLAKPEEIASVVVFLAGDGASYLTATTVFADGGIMQSSPGL